MKEFNIGEYIEIICHDGKSFRGWLRHWTPHWVQIDGLLFPLDDVRAMTHG